MIVTLDVSAAVEIVMGGTKKNQIIPILKKADMVIAPTLYIYESSNVMWKYHTISNIPVNELLHKIEHLYNLIDQYIEASEVYRQSLSLACKLGHPAYDAVYIITCRNNNASLLSLDSRLIKAAQKADIPVCFLQ